MQQSRICIFAVLPAILRFKPYFQIVWSSKEKLYRI